MASSLFLSRKTGNYGTLMVKKKGARNVVSFLLTSLRLFKAILRMVRRKLFWSVLSTLGLILLSGTLFYHQVEGWRFLDSFYFSFTTLMPTGLDNGLSPSTDFSKFFTMIYLVVGTGAMLSMLVLIGIAVLDFERKELKEESKKHD